MKIYDRYGREINNLRIIVTTQCNYNCIFCHSEGYYHCSGRNSSFLNPREVELIGSVAIRLGIDKVKITGGEPLLHTDICDVVRALKDLGFSDISMVTNGYYLASFAEKLKDSGLERVNINIPSLRESKYSYITGTKNALTKVIEGVKIAKETDLYPVKINVVILRDINDEEWPRFIDFARKMGVYLQFIEYHSSDASNDDFKRFYRPIDDIERYLSEHAEKIFIRPMHHRRRYILEDGTNIDIVRPMFNPEFCMNCSRIRATPTGWKPCLLTNEIINYTQELGRQDITGLTKKLLKAIHIRKPFFEENKQEEI